MTTQTIRFDSASALVSGATSQTLSRFAVVATDGNTVVAGQVPAPTATNAAPYMVYRVSHAPQAEAAPPFDDFDQLVAEMDAQPASAALLADGRRWVGRAFYGKHPTLASLRLAVGLSQRALGERCGLQQPHVSRYESGRHEPTIATAHALAQAIGVDLNTFYAAWAATLAETEQANAP